MLDLGLARIGKLLAGTQFPWRAIHVAGTNGKGSVCSYISSMLKVSGLRYGQFTSPHLIDRWDCITLNGNPIEKALFEDIEKKFVSTSQKQNIGATEFELLTATAFEAFSHHRIDVGVVEVGLGGRLDATNVLESPLASVITKIGLDHQSLLGDTIEEISWQKAGIMKSGIPCFIDGSNTSRVQKILSEAARDIQAGEIKFVLPNNEDDDESLWNFLTRSSYADHQQMNITIAHEVVKSTLSKLNIPYDAHNLAQSVTETVWPGRLQTIDLSSIISRNKSALLDGAHNPQAAEALSRWVESKVRNGAEPVTWLLAMSDGKDLSRIIPSLIRPNDKVITTAFSPVDGMPWVQPIDPGALLGSIENLVGIQEGKYVTNIELAIKETARMAGKQPIVIAGSLYLVSDILRLFRTIKGKDKF